MGYNLMREKYMDYGFDLNSYVDNLADGYGVFDDVVDSLDFAAVGINTDDPRDYGERKGAPNVTGGKKSEGNKKNNNKTIKLVNSSPKGTKKRGRKPGQKPRCGLCGELGHTRRTCPSL